MNEIFRGAGRGPRNSRLDYGDDPFHGPDCRITKSGSRFGSRNFLKEFLRFCYCKSSFRASVRSTSTLIYRGHIS